MSKFLGEHAKFTKAIIAAAVSSADSEPIALRDVSRVTIHCGILGDLATAKTFTAAPASFNVVVGTAATAVSAMTALSSGGINLGETTALEFHEWETVRVVAGAGASARKADGRTLILDGVTFTFQEAASIADNAAKSVIEHAMQTSKAIAELVAELKQRPCIRSPKND